MMEKCEPNKFRSDFPIFREDNNASIYLDNAATTHKPYPVIKAINDFYSNTYSNIGRGGYSSSVLSTKYYEESREKVMSFIGARSMKEIIFVRGATEALNLIAYSYGRNHIKEGDEVFISAIEHHSNILPWQRLCEEKGAKLIVMPTLSNGEVDVKMFENLISSRTKLVSIAYVSNTTGTINPIREIIQISKKNNCKVIIDGSQAIAHIGIDVQELDCDFFTFSAHKVFGPTGIGVLYGKESILTEMPPYQVGGGMANFVSNDIVSYKHIPQKFEAGTPNICGAIGLNAAIEYVQSVGMNNITEHEKCLTNYTLNNLRNISCIDVIGPPDNHLSIISFTMKGVHSHDIGQILDFNGIAVRTGRLCSHPVMSLFEINSLTRVSLTIYNSNSEIDKLVECLKYIKDFFKK